MSDDKNKDVNLADDLFADDSTELQSNWMKFENPGDTCAGVLVEKYDKTGDFGEQTIFVLEQPDGSVMNVGLNKNSHKRTLSGLMSAQTGDQVAFRFVDTYKSKYGTEGKNITARHRRVETKDEIPFA